MTELSKKWIEIGKLLIKDSSLKLKCPVCEVGFIEVVDQSFTNNDTNDRYLICGNCKSWNVITMSQKID